MTSVSDMKCAVKAILVLQFLVLLIGVSTAAAPDICAPILLVPQTDQTSNDEPRWSPDGNWIAYRKWDSGASESSVYKIPATGGPEVLVVQDGLNPRWSPDGNTIAFVKAGASIYTIPSSGGSPTFITDGILPEWSPDGTRICYFGNWGEIRTIPVAGGPSILITAEVDPSLDYYYWAFGDVEWSPDGNWIVYSKWSDDMGSFSIFKALSLGGFEVQLTYPSSWMYHCYPQWSPDGRWISYFDDSYGLCKVDFLGKQSYPLMKIPSFGYYNKASWSPDGDWLVTPMDMDGYGGGPLVRVGSEGGSAFLTWDIKAWDNSYCPWSPDGRWIAMPAANGAIYKVPSEPCEGQVVADCLVPMSGDVFVGRALDGDTTDSAGMAASVQGSTTHILSYFNLSKRWTTAVTIGNLSSSTEANVELRPYPASGASLPRKRLEIPVNGQVSENIDRIFDGFNLSGVGWIQVTSDVDTVASLILMDKTKGGIASVPTSEAQKNLYLPYFAPGLYDCCVGVSIVNPNATSVQIRFDAYAGGTLQGGTGWTTIPAHGMVSGSMDSLVGIQPIDGWVAVRSKGGDVAGLFTLQKPSDPSVFAAFSATSPMMDMNFSSFVSNADAKTKIFLVNPWKIADATVTLEAHRGDGTLIDQKIITIKALSRLIREVGSLFSLGTDTAGWVEVKSSAPLVGLQVFSGDAWPMFLGLAAVEPQESGNHVYVPHYTSAGDWNTWLSLANPDDVSSVTPNMLAFGQSGLELGNAAPIIPANGQLLGEVRELFDSSL